MGNRGQGPGAGKGAAARVSRPALVVDIKRNSLDDGPGIRSVVFFKGCPLSCVWCQNPESLSPLAQLQRLSGPCLACGACRRACPREVARPVAEGEAAGGCKLCGACVEACPAGARRIAGTPYEREALVALLKRDAPFYAHSGGGVTLSGGEPTLHMRYVGALARRLKEEGIAVLLETCGVFGWKGFARHLLPHLDTIYFDLKLADAGRHRRYTGLDNGVILANLERLVASGFPDLMPRLPLIPGITDTSENLQGVAAIMGLLKLGRMALLPYNPLWLDKGRALGLELAYAHDSFMAAEEVARCREFMKQAGIEIIS